MLSTSSHPSIPATFVEPSRITSAGLGYSSTSRSAGRRVSARRRSRAEMKTSHTPAICSSVMGGRAATATAIAARSASDSHPSRVSRHRFARRSRGLRVRPARSGPLPVVVIAHGPKVMAPLTGTPRRTSEPTATTRVLRAQQLSRPTTTRGHVQRRPGSPMHGRPCGSEVARPRRMRAH